MQLLKSLKLVHYEHPTHRNPRLHRRHKLLTKLDDSSSLPETVITNLPKPNTLVMRRVT